MKRLTIVVCLILVPSCMWFFAKSRDANADPIRETDRFAWQLFLSINQPDDKERLAWEKWARAQDVFNSATDKPVFPKQVAEGFALSQPASSDLSAAPPDMDKVRKDIDLPQPCDPTVTDKGEQVMLNKATVDYIANKGLYSVEGQIARSKAERIDFPKDSIEVKAVWRHIGEGETNDYYYQKCGSSPFGLIALHLTSKQTPNWVWATFEHVKMNAQDIRNGDQCRFIPCKDSFGAASSEPTQDALSYKPSQQLRDLLAHSGLPGKWQRLWLNYRLIGTQVYFTERGKLLGNSVIEQPFKDTPSCITCHSRSTISDDMTRLRPGQSKTVSFNGEPDPCWFKDKHDKVIFRQLDFVWSLMMAKSRDQKSPSPTNGLATKFVSNYCGSDLSLAPN